MFTYLERVEKHKTSMRSSSRQSDTQANCPMLCNFNPSRSASITKHTICRSVRDWIACTTACFREPSAMLHINCIQCFGALDCTGTSMRDYLLHMQITRRRPRENMTEPILIQKHLPTIRTSALFVQANSANLPAGFMFHLHSIARQVLQAAPAGCRRVSSINRDFCAQPIGARDKSSHTQHAEVVPEEVLQWADSGVHAQLQGYIKICAAPQLGTDDGLQTRLSCYVTSIKLLSESTVNKHQ